MAFIVLELEAAVRFGNQFDFEGEGAGDRVAVPSADFEGDGFAGFDLLQTCDGDRVVDGDGGLLGLSLDEEAEAVGCVSGGTGTDVVGGLK